MTCWISLLLPFLLLARTLVAQDPATHPALARALAEIRVAETARLRGDTAAWKLVSPAFSFAHSVAADESSRVGFTHFTRAR